MSDKSEENKAMLRRALDFEWHMVRFGVAVQCLKDCRDDKCLPEEVRALACAAIDRVNAAWELLGSETRDQVDRLYQVIESADGGVSDDS